MMKRLDKVYQALCETWEGATKDKIESEVGTSAQELALQLDLTRANVSLELNKLVRDGRCIKIKHYPVRYLPTHIIEAEYIEKFDVPIEIKDIHELFDSETLSEKKSEKTMNLNRSSFDTIIGYDGSLKKAVSQAKAAVHYPPNGLHMLLVGATGSGKTFFANSIFRYAVDEEIIGQDAPFKSLNCADYYNNPQLLLSQLFGFSKGAYTGAVEDSEGLVEQSDGGILLLDEIHRLPPEGQEMLFYFIDKGTFSRLGESGKVRHAKVLIICATTENPSSALLSTFLRRIPMTIEIPALKDRSINEKVELTKYLFKNESKRIQKDLRVHIDVINTLIQATNYGNVGQLKSQIQLVCAHAFLNHFQDSNEIEITLSDLTEDLKLEWIHRNKNSNDMDELHDLVDVTTFIHANDGEISPLEEYNDFNLYELIEEKVNVLKKEGIDENEIHQYILTDLHLHIRNSVSPKVLNFNLLKFVDTRVSDFTEKLKQIAEEEMNVKFDRHFSYYVGMHIDAFLKRGSKSTVLLGSEIESIKAEHPKEYTTALKFKQEFLTEFHIELPEIEVIFLTMLLHSIETMEDTKRVSVLVVAHGNSTASSMVDVAKDLLGSAMIEGIDMPLSLSPEELFQVLVERIKLIDQGMGVLMLVDMGSLSMIESKLMKETGIKIRTIPNVTTSMVLDVFRKIKYMDLDLNAIYHSVRQDFYKSNQIREELSSHPSAILSICMSGSGTAKKLESMLTSLIYETTDEVVEVVSLSALKMKQKLPELQEKYSIIASVGTKNPKIDAPFISLENLIEGSGEMTLRHLLNPKNYSLTPTNSQTVVVRNLCEETLKMYLVYLNPYHVADLLLDWTSEVELKVGEEFSNSFIIKLVVHTAFAVERAVKGTQLTYDETVSDETEQCFNIVTTTLLEVEEKFSIELSRDEKLFIAEIIVDIN